MVREVLEMAKGCKGWHEEQIVWCEKIFPALLWYEKIINPCIHCEGFYAQEWSNKMYQMYFLYARERPNKMDQVYFFICPTFLYARERLNKIDQMYFFICPRTAK